MLVLKFLREDCEITKRFIASSRYLRELLSKFQNLVQSFFGRLEHRTSLRQLLTNQIGELLPGFYHAAILGLFLELGLAAILREKPQDNREQDHRAGPTDRRGTTKWEECLRIQEAGVVARVPQNKLSPLGG